MLPKIKEIGYGLISLFIFQIALSVLSIKTSMNFLQIENITNISSLSYPQLYGEAVASLLIIIAIILFIFSRRLGTILYISAILLSVILSFAFANLTFIDLSISLIIPIITLILIYIKRDILF